MANAKVDEVTTPRPPPSLMQSWQPQSRGTSMVACSQSTVILPLALSIGDDWAFHQCSSLLMLLAFVGRKLREQLYSGLLSKSAQCHYTSVLHLFSNEKTGMEWTQDTMLGINTTLQHPRLVSVFKLLIFVPGCIGTLNNSCSFLFALEISICYLLKVLVIVVTLNVIKKSRTIQDCTQCSIIT